MLSGIQRKGMIRWIVALFCAVIFVCMVFAKEEKSLRYDVVILGDSVVGNNWSDNSLDAVMAKKLGISVFNGGFGGSCMSITTTEMWGSKSSTEWCMVKLAEAICYDDWTGQTTTMQYANSYNDVNVQAFDYMVERMDNLSQIDYSQVDVLIIEHGTNDYNNGRKVDNPKDLYDVTTFGGALRYCLRLFQETYPQLQLVIVSPIYCELGDTLEQKCYNTCYGEGGTLDEYVALEQEIAREFGVEWIDAYHGSGIWEDNAETYLSDGLHLRAIGHEKLSNMVTEELAAILNNE